MAACFTNIGPAKGPWLDRDDRLACAIGVLRAPDNHMPIGMALAVGRDDRGVRLWRLSLHNGTELPGRWVVISRKFFPAP